MINPAVAVAREQSRQHDSGQFGIQAHADAGIVDVPDPDLAPAVPTVDQEALWYRAEEATYSNYDAEEMWEGLMRDSITPHMFTVMTPKRWRQYNVQAGNEPEKLVAVMTMTADDGTDYEARATSEVTPVLVDGDMMTELGPKDVLAASPAGAGDGVFFDSAMFTRGDPDEAAYSWFLDKDSQGFYSDEFAAGVDERWQEMLDQDPGYKSQIHDDYISSRRHWAAFAKTCTDWPGFQASLRYRVDTKTTVDRAPGSRSGSRVASRTTAWAMSDADAMTTAIAMNQTGVILAKPEDYFHAPVVTS